MNNRNRNNYPQDWKAAAYAIKVICGWQCMQCGIQCRRPDEPFDSYKRTLTVAHYDHDYESAEIYVACLCVPCHFAHDAPHSWKARQRNMRLRQWMAGQLAMEYGLISTPQLPHNYPIPYGP